MTDPAQPGQLAALEPLEPLDAGAPTTPVSGGDDQLVALTRAGLSPAYNPYCRDKSFYRFLFAGVMIVFGCLMPFSAEITRAGYQTMSGGLYTLIGIAMIWSWWGAIAHNRAMGVKWLLLATLPLIGTIYNLVSFDVAEAYDRAQRMNWLPGGIPHSESLKAVFGDMLSAIGKSDEAAQRVETFWRLFGPGQVFVLLGALIAELGLLGGLLGGHKKNKSDMKAKMMAVGERKRR